MSGLSTESLVAALRRFHEKSTKTDCCWTCGGNWPCFPTQAANRLEKQDRQLKKAREALEEIP